MSRTELPVFADVQAAAARLAGKAHKTPVLTSTALDELSGAELFFKCEPFQRTGAFKFRGATNAVFALSEAAAARGVLTHSSGNHGQALALAARLRGIQAVVVMPKNSAAVKVEAVRGYGASVVFCEPTTADRERVAAALIAESGATLVHPYDSAHVIAGQGTAALELLQTVPGLTAVITPVGGGGLVSGTALAVSGISPETAVYGGEPELADDAARSLRTGQLQTIGRTDTIADGLRSSSLGPLAFALVTRHVRAIFTVSEAEIVQAMRLVWERLKVVIEPSSAVPVAAVLQQRSVFGGQRVGIILTGGNVDVGQLPF